MSGLFRAQPTIDLHMHSKLSDGTDSPAGVVEEAHAAGVRTMALTDHDITRGWTEAREACQRLDMTFIAGCEFSVTTSGAGGMHLLGYMFDPEDPVLSAMMTRVTEGKVDRVARIITSLQSDSFDITLDEVLLVAGEAHPQRPHVAQVLLDKGYIKSITQGIKELLSSHGPHYVPTVNKPQILEAIRAIRHAGGVSILAHPCARTDRTMPKHHLQTMLEAGLGGLELDHRENKENNPEALATLWEYHREFDFIVTGSSDYHGTRKVNRPGENTTSEEMLQRLIESARGSSGSAGTEPVYPPAV